MGVVDTDNANKTDGVVKNGDGDGGNDGDNGNGNGDDNGNVVVETRHALSLRQQQPQPRPKPQLSQPSPPRSLNSKPIETPKTIGQQRFQNQGKNTISSIIGGYKSAVTKHANRLGFDFAWQSRFYDHIIRDEKSFHNISEYIMNNPLNWSEDKFY